MLERLLDRRPAELALVQPRNGPPDPVDHDPLEVLAALVAERHGERRVFRIDRKEALGLALHQVHHELATDHERFLVGERDRLPGLQRGQRGAEAGRSDQPVENEVGVGLRRAMTSAASGPTISSTPFTWPSLALTSAAAFLVRDGDERGQEFRAWPTSSSWFIPRRRQTDDLEPLRVPAHDVERLRPDGPGRAEMAIDRMAWSLPEAVRNAVNWTLREDHAEEQEGGRSHEQERIDPVEDPAVARENRSHVLHPDIPLHHRLGEIAQRGGDRHHQAEQQRVDPPVSRTGRRRT